MVNVDEGKPLGETLMCLPAEGGEAVKKTCCSSAYIAIEEEGKNIGEKWCGLASPVNSP